MGALPNPMLLPSTPTQANPIFSIVKQAEVLPPKEQLYYTIPGDILGQVAAQNNTTVQRIFDKNPDIKDPDKIDVGQKIVIPQPEEQLADRPMPVSIEATAGRSTSPPSGGFSNGAYPGGWCTSWASSRHQVPGNLGNADTWLYMAKADGLATGSVPQVGAVAVAAAYTHVAIVEKVDGDRVYVSEMNYNKYNEVDYRWTPLSEWQGYIY